MKDIYTPTNDQGIDEKPVQLVDFGGLNCGEIKSLGKTTMSAWVNRMTEEMYGRFEKEKREEREARNAEYLAIILADQRKRNEYTQPILDSLGPKF
jgi:hypothetical protein